MRDSVLFLVALYFVLTSLVYACYLPIINSNENDFMCIVLGLLLGWVLFPMKVIKYIIKLLKGKIEW